MADDTRLKALEDKVDMLLKLAQQNANNLITIYRRTTALAHMIEAVAGHREPRLPLVVRAEIDASLDPVNFANLAQEDPEEFKARYGELVLEILKQYGMDAISKIGELTPEQKQQVN